MDYSTVENLKSIVRESIETAENPKSRIPREVAMLRGFSSPKIRRFLNRLCSYGPCLYLEIGTWSGSTLISACYGNEAQAVAIDDWSQFPADEMTDGFDAKKELFKNIDRFLKPGQVKVIERNCFEADPVEGVNVFFYDGNHDEPSTRRAIGRFGGECQQPFLLVVDDWELTESVVSGTLAALDQFTLHESWHLKKTNGYHEGVWIGVVESIRGAQAFSKHKI